MCGGMAFCYDRIFPTCEDKYKAIPVSSIGGFSMVLLYALEKWDGMRGISVQLSDSFGIRSVCGLACIE